MEGLNVKAAIQMSCTLKQSSKQSPSSWSKWRSAKGGRCCQSDIMDNNLIFSTGFRRVGEGLLTKELSWEHNKVCRGIKNGLLTWCKQNCEGGWWSNNQGRRGAEKSKSPTVKILIKIGEPVEKNGELCVAHRTMCITLTPSVYSDKNEACTNWESIWNCQ